MWLAIRQPLTVEEDQGAGFVCVGQPLVPAGNSGLHAFIFGHHPLSCQKRRAHSFWGDLMETVLSSKLLHPITASGGPRIPFQGLHFLILFWKASLQPFH